MNLTNITALPTTHASPAAERVADAAVQFDAILYRLMLQNLDLMSDSGAGRKAGQGMFRELVTDFLAGEAARQQAGYGAMMLNMSNTVKGGNP